MKQVTQVYRTGEVKVLDVPAPSLLPHGVLVSTRFSLISAGTERAKVDLGRKNLLAKARSRPDQVRQVLEKIRRDGVLQTYETVKARLEEPSPLGYSSAGVVLAVGDLAEGFCVGDRVACAGAGYANHAEIAYVPQNLCVPVPSVVDFEDAAYATVGAIALQGVRQAEVRLGDRVGVIGLGLVGQLTAQLLSANGCHVFGIDLSDARCDLALKGSAAFAAKPDDSNLVAMVEEFTGGIGLDAVIVTAGTSSNQPVELAGELARDRGCVVIVGDVGLKVPRKAYYEKELSLKLSRSYGPGRYDPDYEELGLDYPEGYVRWTERRNLDEFLRLIAAGKVDVKRLTTHRFPVDEGARAFEVLSAGSENALGVLLEYELREAEPRRIVTKRDGRSAPSSSVAPVAVSMIGAGNFATSTLLPALKEDLGVGLLGVHTAGGVSARDVGDRYGFEYCSDSVEELLKDSRCTGVIVATRHDSHAGLTVAAVKAGKHVFVEKPLATSEDQVSQVVDAWQASGVNVLVGFNRRFSPAAQTIRRTLAGRVGPVFVSCRINAGPLPATHWTKSLEQGGGRIVGEMCHFIDLACFLCGQPPVEVYTTSIDNDNAPALRESVSAILSFEDGSRASISYLANGDAGCPKERVEVFCERRVFVIDDFKSLTTFQGGRERTERYGRTDKGHKAEMRAFIAMLRGIEPATLPFREAVASTVATFKVIESLTTGLPVKLSPLFATSESQG